MCLLVDRVPEGMDLSYSRRFHNRRWVLGMLLIWSLVYTSMFFGLLHTYNLFFLSYHYNTSVSMSLVLCSLNSSYHLLLLPFLILLKAVLLKPKYPRTASATSAIILVAKPSIFRVSQNNIAIGIIQQQE